MHFSEVPASGESLEKVYAEYPHQYQKNNTTPELDDYHSDHILPNGIECFTLNPLPLLADSWSSGLSSCILRLRSFALGQPPSGGRGFFHLMD
jgi:hypothetical protein